MPTLRPRKRHVGASAPSSLVDTSSTNSGVSDNSTAVPPSSSAGLKKRAPRVARDEKRVSSDEMRSSDEERPFLDGPTPGAAEVLPRSGSWMQRNQWIVYALASGACAAFNGVFAKLTTTKLTATFSLAIARLFGLESVEGVIEFIVRCIFFGLNLVFNGVMWTLFTQALARGNSTTQVSIMNTSSNFVITAVLGFAIFSEALPPLWWLGATMLVAGNVVVGRKDEGVSSPQEDEEVQVQQQQGGETAELVTVKDESDEDLVDLGSALEEAE